MFKWLGKLLNFNKGSKVTKLLLVLLAAFLLNALLKRLTIFETFDSNNDLDTTNEAAEDSVTPTDNILALAIMLQKNQKSMNSRITTLETHVTKLNDIVKKATSVSIPTMKAPPGGFGGL